MSLLEMLVEKKIILIGLGLTGSLLMLAILIAVLATVRRANAAQAVRRQRLLRQQRLAQAVEDEIEQADDEDALEIAVPARPVETKAGWQQKPVTVIQTAPETPASAQTDTDEPEMSDAMRDIIESVFMDEEVFAHYEVLLRDTTPVAIGDLLTLSKNVAAKLRKAS